MKSRVLILAGLLFFTHLWTAQAQTDQRFGNQGVATIENPPNAQICYGRDAVEGMNGKIWAVGFCNTQDFGGNLVIARFLHNGLPDASFNDVGWTSIDFVDDSLNRRDSVENFSRIKKLADGKMLLIGSQVDFNASVSQYENLRIILVRLNPDGQMDLTFGKDLVIPIPGLSPIISPNIKRGWTTVPIAQRGGGVADALLQPDGKLLVGGEYFLGDAGSGSAFFVARLNVDGSLDSGFGDRGIFMPGIAGKLNNLSLDGEGKVLVGTSGLSAFNYPDSMNSIFRLKANGSLDESFGSNGRVSFNSNTSLATAVSNLGQIYHVLGATFNRLQSNGAIDEAFSETARAPFDAFLNDAWYNIALSPGSGALLLGAKKVVKATLDGGLDNSFGTGGVARIPEGFEIAVGGTYEGTSIVFSNGRVLIPGGVISSDNRGSKLALLAFPNPLNLQNLPTRLPNDIRAPIPQGEPNPDAMQLAPGTGDEKPSGESIKPIFSGKPVSNKISPVFNIQKK